MSDNVRRADFLDVARGLAILGVMAVHTSQHYPSGLWLIDKGLFLGQFGVQLFFVISAYTMCMTMQARQHLERRAILAFWVRRFARLSVPMWVAIFVYQAFAWAGNPHFAARTHDGWVLLSTALLANGLWPSAMSAAVPGGGSIATEALFYLIFPALFLLRHRLDGLALVCIVTVIADHALVRPALSAWLAYPDGSTQSYDLRQFFHYGIVKQLPVFIMGIAIHTLSTRAGVPPARTIVAWVIAAAVCVAGSTFIAVVGLASAALLLWLQQRQAASRVLGWLGQRSYSLYLFHFAVLNGVMAHWPGTTNNIVQLPAALAAVVSLSCAVAAVTRPALEDMGSALGRRLVAHWRL